MADRHKRTRLITEDEVRAMTKGLEISDSTDSDESSLLNIRTAITLFNQETRSLLANADKTVSLSQLERIWGDMLARFTVESTNIFTAMINGINEEPLIVKKKRVPRKRDKAFIA
jgi:hypothetical protein